ncbi:MAG TPA: asparaginase [Hyphomicrobiaceae bacterium]|nr:asparaginase [Hyphomicrobiaceae bacterium]
MAGNKPKVGFIGTGGTISSLGSDALDLIDYPDSGNVLEIDALLEKFPSAGAFVEPVPIRFKAIGSTKVTPDDWLALNKLITKTAADNPDISGFVITHGTASAEETVYFLNLTLKTDKPVVVVGAQRPASAISTDAAINLVNAARTAADPASRGMGALLMLNDEIQAAREVTKTSTLRMQTFRTPDFGVLGQVDGDGVHYYRAPLRRRMPDTEFDVAHLTSLPRVDIVSSYAGADGVAIAAFVAAGAKGLVSAGFAPGLLTPAQNDAFGSAIAQGVAVVQSSRAGSGRVPDRASLKTTQVISADNLNPQKARILLMVGLTLTQDVDELRRIFSEY